MRAWSIPTCMRGSLLATCMLGVMGTVAAGQASESRTTLHVEPSSFAPVVIYETATERCMTFTRVNNPNAESCYRLADPEAVAFDYTRMMVSALMVKPAPQRMLLIGLGGGTLATTLATLVPDASIDSVEIDPAVVSMATRYFGYRISPMQRVHIADGRAFIVDAAEKHERYDMVLLDAFSDDYIPAHMMTREFLGHVRGVLAPDGIVVANTAGEGPLHARETATYQAVFGTVLNFPARNRIIVASSDPLPGDDALRRHEALWRARLAQVGINSSVFFDRLQRLTANSLRHDAAPADATESRGSCGRDATSAPRVLTDAAIDQAMSQVDPCAHLP
ncbi:MAG: fused MFS/spermidine synthase [Burkholderiaceae bacterium]